MDCMCYTGVTLARIPMVGTPQHRTLHKQIVVSAAQRLQDQCLHPGEGKNLAFDSESQCGVHSTVISLFGYSTTLQILRIRHRIDVSVKVLFRRKHPINISHFRQQFINATPEGAQYPLPSRPILHLSLTGD